MKLINCKECSKPVETIKLPILDVCKCHPKDDEYTLLNDDGTEYKGRWRASDDWSYPLDNI